MGKGDSPALLRSWPETVLTPFFLLSLLPNYLHIRWLGKSESKQLFVDNKTNQLSKQLQNKQQNNNNSEGKQLYVYILFNICTKLLMSEQL